MLRIQEECILGMEGLHPASDVGGLSAFRCFYASNTWRRSRFGTAVSITAFGSPVSSRWPIEWSGGARAKLASVDGEGFKHLTRRSESGGSRAHSTATSSPDVVSPWGIRLSFRLPISAVLQPEAHQSRSPPPKLPLQFGKGDLDQRGASVGAAIRHLTGEQVLEELSQFGFA